MKEYWKSIPTTAVAAKPRKPRAKPVDRETPVQRAIIKAIGLLAPKVYVAHVPNGGKRHPRAALKLKLAGVKAGVPDLLVILSSGEVAFIEVKAPGGVSSDAQKEFARMCMERRTKMATLDDASHVRTVLEAWGELPFRLTVPVQHSKSQAA